MNGPPFSPRRFVGNAPICSNVSTLTKGSVVFIEQSPRGYDRSGQQVVRRARFLILVSLGLERTEVTCKRCNGTKRTTNYYGDDDLIERSCPNCIPIECTAWLAQHPTFEVADIVITQSSDSAFHCIAITVFYRDPAHVARTFPPARRLTFRGGE